MTMTNMAKRTAAGTLALAVCIGGGALALAGSANAAGQLVTTPPYLREGRSLVIVTGENPYDALSAGPLASEVKAPLLFQSPSPTLMDNTQRALNRAKYSKDPIKVVYVVGGYAAVNRTVIDQLLAQDVTVVQFGGADRYVTAEYVSWALDQAHGKEIPGP